MESYLCIFPWGSLTQHNDCENQPYFHWAMCHTLFIPSRVVFNSDILLFLFSMSYLGMYSLAFSMIQRMLAIWSLVPLPFLKPACTYWPGEFFCQYPIILSFHTVHGVPKARILKWFASLFSSGPHSVRPLHHDPPILGGPTGMA